MTATTISFRADEQTMAELRQLAGDGNLSDAIRELIHAQYTARLYAQAAKDAAGHEQRGPRYAVAIQSDAILLSTLIVAPTSTSAQPAIFRPEIEMDGTRTRLLVDQIAAVD